MTHANAPLTPTGRLRMVHRHLNDGIPQSHVAAEFRVSRPTVATWVAPIGMYSRQTTRDTVLQGVHLPAGAKLGISLLSANCCGS